jgi:hypothetical protein
MSSIPVNDLPYLYDQLSNRTIALLNAMHSKKPDPFLILSLRNEVKQLQKEILEKRKRESMATK